MCFPLLQRGCNTEHSVTTKGETQMHPSTSLANTFPNCFLSKSLNMNKVKLFCDASIMQQHSNLAAAFVVIEMKEAHPDALDKLLVVRSTIVMNDSYRQLHVGGKPQ